MAKMVYTSKNSNSNKFAFHLREESIKDIFKNLSSLANDLDNISDERMSSLGPNGSFNKDSQEYEMIRRNSKCTSERNHNKFKIIDQNDE